ncbi:unnamed protein product [Clonostachys rhizophaga]|uniref:Uncharacterized protein n=1 Tax=Clonostachys rhizophaga TaxID=160324 RepID=A0A9N9V683_9HYPO|nr:unnamed protein product [Clonostachys rhizophaga]
MASGADKGFFQQAPSLENHFRDATYQRCFKLFLPAHVISATQHEVEYLGDEVIADQIFRWISDAERNPPFLRGSGRDVFGQWTGELVTGEGWRQLQDFGIKKGFVATGYDAEYGPFSRPLQFLRLLLWEPSCANVTCPSAMQDGAARVLQTHLASTAQPGMSDEQRLVFRAALRRLLSRDPKTAWTSGQWMTERTGGSDVSQTETRAEHKPDASETVVVGGEEARLGPWSINGFKWFSSATDSQMTILLAKTPKGALSAFFAPMRKGVGGSVDNHGQLNGVRIQRLKDKVGTRSLPTAELVIEDMRAWMIGKEGHGVHEVRTILAITRVHSAVAAVGYVGRGLSIARAYARVRDIGEGKGRRTKLTDSVLHMRTLSDMFVQYRGMMMLTIFTSYVLGLSEHNSDGRAMAGEKTKVLDALTPPQEHVAGLIRILTQLTKAYVCQESVSILFSCMEALGGVGYLNNAEQEHLNISRLWRDCAVLPIWEGTTNVLCTDFIKTVRHPAAGKETLDALRSFVQRAAAFQGPGHANLPVWNPVQRWDVIERRLLSESPDELMRNARDHVWQTAQLLASLLLYADAQTDGDPVACDVHKRFAQCSNIGLNSGPMTSPETSLGMDSAIVYGGGPVHHGRPKL